MVITTSRWKLKKAVRLVNQVLERLKLEKHPDKAFIGRAWYSINMKGL